jgi:hypothetical protein
LEIERLYLYEILKEQVTEYLKFDAKNFSKFKYGSNTKAREYGFQLAKLFFQNYGAELLRSKSYITCSAYKTVPNAAFTLMFHIQAALNHYLYRYYKAPPLDYQPLRRETLYEGDYGKLSFQEREQVMNKNVLYINEKAIYRTQILVVDDIRITGLHEEKISRILEQGGVQKVYYLYIINANITEPSLEYDLNHAFVRRLQDFIEIWQEQDYVLNSRACRFLLSYKDRQELIAFFQKSSRNFLELLYAYFLADGYNAMPNYQEGFELFEQYYQTRSSFLTLLKGSEVKPPP